MQVAILGGGLAGAAAAWALARRGARVVLLEKEPVRGAHASGRNAGLIRRVAEDPLTASLLREGADLLLRPPSDLAREPLYRVTGSLLLGLGRDATWLRSAAREASAAGVECEVRDPRAVDLRGVDPGPVGEGVAVWTAADGVADPHAVLSALHAAAAACGAEVLLSSAAAVLVEGGRARGLVHAGGRVLADEVVLAAGPWAAELGAAAGALPIPLASYRRHLFWTGPLAPAPDPRAPWVWDVSRGLYARSESGGLLLCPCDQDLRPPEDARPDPRAEELLARKVAEAAPGLASLPVARAWAGLRGFVPDRRFVIGPDPWLPGLHWLTALGGHGLTAACAVGELLARSLFEEPDARLAELAPGRLTPEPSGVS